MEEIIPRKYCIFIISYKRADFCRRNTFRILNSFNHKAPVFIVCSDDDPTLEEYYRIYGKDNVIVFSKMDIQKRYRIDLSDCYHGKSNKWISTVWVRTAQFEIARQKGFEYFLTLDDDYLLFGTKIIIEDNGKKKLREINNPFRFIDFDVVSEYMFRILDSQKFMSCVSFAQNGDFMGGISHNFIQTYKFKAMNFIYGTTKKMFRYIGRMNEDVNKYLVDNNIGKLSMMLTDISLKQVNTQKTSGGMTDIYKNFGTYMKSFYSVIHNPSAVKINALGGTSETYRIHHIINYDRSVPKILNERYCKNENHNQDEYIDYLEMENNVVKENRNCDIKDYSFDELTQISYISENDNVEELF